MAAQVLFESDRTCCVCRARGRPVQLHHIDGDPSNSKPDNLAVLCFDCHRETQVRGGFDRKLDALQIQLYRSDWLSRVTTRRDREHGPSIRRAEERRVVRYLQVDESSDEYSYSFKADYPEINSGNISADANTNLRITEFMTRTLDRFRSDAKATSQHKDEMRRAGSSVAWDDLSVSHTSGLLLPTYLQLSSQSEATMRGQHIRTQIRIP